jgi:hypothetical protein
MQPPQFFKWCTSHIWGHSFTHQFEKMTSQDPSSRSRSITSPTRNSTLPMCPFSRLFSAMEDSCRGGKHQVYVKCGLPLCDHRVDHRRSDQQHP